MLIINMIIKNVLFISKHYNNKTFARHIKQAGEQNAPPTFLKNYMSGNINS